MEVSKLPETQFKTMVIRMLRKLSENFSSMENDIETIKRNQSEMKNTPEGINSRLEEPED